ncbi:MAG: hypothetical protein OXI12_12220 [Gammaproteobacteria bacterium]|nr:hypothetical protein [Gammaproteobacteria bacterium]
MRINRRNGAGSRHAPAEEADGVGAVQTIQQLRSLREGVKLRGMNWKVLRDHGRR